MRYILNFTLKLFLLFSVLAAAIFYSGMINFISFIILNALSELTGFVHFKDLLFISYVVIFFAILGVFRALLRVNPVQMGVDRPTRKLNEFVFFTWVSFIFSTVCILSIIVPVSVFMEKEGISFEQLNLSHFTVTNTMYLVFFCLAPIFSGFLMFRFIKMRDRLFEHENSVLFLRRFGSVGEFELLPLVIRSISRKQRIFMLIEQSALLKAWDFNTICFTPFVSTRLDSTCYLSGRDDEWEGNVELLILRAKNIVMDISDISTSIHTEINLLRSLNAIDRTVWVTPLSLVKFRNTMKSFGVEIKDEKVISTQSAVRRSSFWRILLYFAAYFYPVMIPWAVLSNNGYESGYFGLFMLIWLAFSIYLGVKVGGRLRFSGASKNNIKLQLRKNLVGA